MKRTEGNSSLIGLVISIPTTQMEGCGYDNAPTFVVKQLENSAGNISPSSERSQFQEQKTASSSDFVKYHSSCQSETDSDEYEFPRLSQADMNDRCRQLKLSNILDF